MCTRRKTSQNCTPFHLLPKQYSQSQHVATSSNTETHASKNPTSVPNSSAKPHKNRIRFFFGSTVDSFQDRRRDLCYPPDTFVFPLRWCKCRADSHFDQICGKVYQNDSLGDLGEFLLGGVLDYCAVGFYCQSTYLRGCPFPKCRGDYEMKV